MQQLTEQELTRYNRQIMLCGWGEAGQEKRKSAGIFIAGAGGLGSPVAIYSAVAGVDEFLKGRLLLFDEEEMSFFRSKWSACPTARPVAVKV